MDPRTPRRIALVGALSLLLAVVVVLVVPPADNYEMSLYNSYPVLLWLFVVAALVFGSVAILASARMPGDRAWAFGLAVLLVTNLLLLMMPYIRGYLMYGRADSLTHLGFVRDIATSGGIAGNIYPPMHVLTLALAEATGSEPSTVAMFVPVVFSGVYFGAMFYLLVYLFDSRQQVLFGAPFVALPVLRYAHVGFRPFDLSVMLLPLALYAFVKSQRHPTAPVRLTFVVTLVGLLLYHPLTAFFTVGVFLIYLAARHAPRITRRHASPTNLFSLSAAVFLVWYSNFSGIILRFDRVYSTVLGPVEGEAPLDSFSDTATEAAPELIDVARVITFKYGVEALLFGLGALFVCFALLLVVRDDRLIDTYTFTFVGVLGLFGLGGGAFLVMDLIVPPERAFQIAKVAAVVLAGQLFYLLWEHTGQSRPQQGIRTGFWAVVVVALLVLATLSVFTVHKSPLTSAKNQQVTEMEVEGTEWLTEYGDEATGGNSEFGLSYFRFYEWQQGTVSAKPFWGTAPPPHFNYTERDSLGESYPSEQYLTVTRLGRVLYPQAFPKYPENWRYTPAEFARLEKDNTVQRVYDNGDYTQYLIMGG